ncbi:GNAT family N-acetyltransferase [Radiobacillus sp. PE A8.2]
MVPFGGIAGVVTWPEYRNKGHVEQLIVQLLHENNKKGIHGQCYTRSL